MRLGALVELLHLASLLHDDVIDRASSRRGQASGHVVAGHEMAVLAGTACMALTGIEAADMGEGVSQAFSGAAAELSYGELLDIERAFDTTLTTEDYVKLAARKTGALFRLACVLGAGEAGVDLSSIERLALFGTELGVAFQISDDCLDLWSIGSGKPTGTDHLLGLFGLPTLCALRAEAGGVKDLLLSPTLQEEDLLTVRDLVAAAGGIEEAQAVAQFHHEAALNSLGQLADTAAGKALVATSETMWRR